MLLDPSRRSHADERITTGSAHRGVPGAYGALASAVGQGAVLVLGDSPAPSQKSSLSNGISSKDAWHARTVCRLVNMEAKVAT
jgi:hypothetical protein